MRTQFLSFPRLGPDPRFTRMFVEQHSKSDILMFSAHTYTFLCSNPTSDLYSAKLVADAVTDNRDKFASSFSSSPKKTNIIPLIAWPARQIDGELIQAIRDRIARRSDLYLWQSCQHGDRDFLFLASVNLAWWLRVNRGAKCWVFWKSHT